MPDTSEPKLGSTPGTGFIFLRKFTQTLGVEQKFLEQLIPADADLMAKILPIIRVPDDVAARIFETAAVVCFPNDPLGLWKLGREQAKHDLTGIYKFLVSLTNVPFIVNQTAGVWTTYHSKGKATSELDKTQKRVRLIVTEYPALPAGIREIVRGYVVGLMELTGAKDCAIRHDASNPNAWVWEITWK
ncbi:MAG: hypothetical protein HGA76_05875 [Candidatus Firestonebacteria bacterium]|nr:hypothetical protein [Candidatus Firestonebacteria bacterium]